MIVTKTPFRISFAGGGTDFAEFYHQFPGCIVSATIDKYIYLSMHPLFNNKGYHLKYFKNELCDSIDKIQHPIIKEVFQRYKIAGVDFNSSSDVPSGTGLGSSSSFTVGLINLCRCLNWKLTPEKFRLLIAEEACKIEIDILKAPIGKQDQYASSMGGLNFIKFHPDEWVDVEKINLSETKLKQLQDSLILFYLGGTREVKTVLSNQKDRISENIEKLKRLAGLAETLKDELNNDSIDHFGEILHEGWMIKRELSYNISNGDVDYWYNEGLKSGAKGGKLLGGGSTGFMLFYASNGAKEILRANLRLLELPFKFENTGTTCLTV
jgi:D-glycero-alpha-D-manno-heptose-7-phosphate kinase